MVDIMKRMPEETEDLKWLVSALRDKINEDEIKIKKLHALEGCGVDNREGYGEAMSLLREEE